MSERYVLGVDIGTSAIKVFIAEKNKDGKAAILGSGFMPADGINKGAVTDLEALAACVSQAIDCALMAAPEAIVHTACLGIGGAELTYCLGTGSIAPANPKSIAEGDLDRLYCAAVLSCIPDSHDVIHILPKCFFLDRELCMKIPLHMQCSCLQLEANIIAVSKKIIAVLTNTLRTKGIHVARVVANAVVAEEVCGLSNEDHYVLVDMGAGTSDVILRSGGQIQFVNSFPYGGDYITGDIMQGLDVSRTHAEKIKFYFSKLDQGLAGQDIILDCNDYGTTDKNFAYDFLDTIIESRAKEIVTLLQEHIAAFSSRVAVDKVFLTGGCALMPSMANQLEKAFGLPVKCVFPGSLELEYSSPANTACYGIIQHAVNEVENGIGHSGGALTFWVSKLKKLFHS
jgi:cell division protein FtsA